MNERSTQISYRFPLNPTDMTHISLGMEAAVSYWIAFYPIWEFNESWGNPYYVCANLHHNQKTIAWLCEEVNKTHTWRNFCFCKKSVNLNKNSKQIKWVIKKRFLLLHQAQNSTSRHAWFQHWGRLEEAFRFYLQEFPCFLHLTA